MKMTSSLKTLLQSKGVKPDATEQEYVKAAYKHLAKVEGDEGFDATFDAKWKETQADEATKGGSALVATLDSIAKGQEAMLKRLEAVEGNGTSDLTSHRLKLNAPAMPDISKALAEGTGEDTTKPGGSAIDVKSVKAMYDRTRKRLEYPKQRFLNPDEPHPFAGKTVCEGQRPIESSSMLDQAVMGAYIKFSLTNNGHKTAGVPRQFWMNDHDKALMDYALNEMEWGGAVHGEGSDVPGAAGIGYEMSGRGQKLSKLLQKAILDDATSGGLEAAPIAFDDALITIPLLHSEFFPKVKVVNITRGRRIEGASIGTVTITTSTEGTAISLFNTASFIAAFDTTIFVASGAIEIGLDFLSDSPIDIAAAVAADYQQVMLQWLDSQVIGGDGTTEPEGILNAAGTTTVNTTNGAGGPWTVGDVEALLFGVTKAYKGGTDPNRIGFGSLETTYRRIRAIAVSTTDQRRVFGMAHEDYKVFMRFWGIGSSGTGGFANNRTAVFGNFARYRMYRRLGMTVKTVTEGATLQRANTMLLIARSRWGGNLEDGASFSITTDGQS